MQYSRVIPVDEADEYVRSLDDPMNERRAEVILRKLRSPCLVCRFEAVVDVWMCSDLYALIDVQPIPGPLCEKHTRWVDTWSQAALEEQAHLEVLDPPRPLPERGLHVALYDVERPEWQTDGHPSLIESIREGLLQQCPLCRQEARLALLSLTHGETDASDLLRWHIEDFCERHRPSLESAGASYWVHHG